MHAHRPKRPPLRAGLPAVIIAGLVLFGVYIAVEGVASGKLRDTLPPGPPVAERALRFTDHAPGVVAVLDADTGEALELLGRDEGMFLRVAMRSFARDRLKIRVGSEQPFELAEWPSGHVTLRDPATGRVMQLKAYGHSQVAAFKKYLTMGGNG
ncbi:MAG: photosynthetic complex assembly protein PuhC [Pseudomonadota bacterium]